jgi:hypothetical protein
LARADRIALRLWPTVLSQTAATRPMHARTSSGATTEVDVNEIVVRHTAQK